MGLSDPVGLGFGGGNPFERRAFGFLQFLLGCTAGCRYGLAQSLLRVALGLEGQALSLRNGFGDALLGVGVGLFDQALRLGLRFLDPSLCILLGQRDLALGVGSRGVLSGSLLALGFLAGCRGILGGAGCVGGNAFGFGLGGTYALLGLAFGLSQLGLGLGAFFGRFLRKLVGLGICGLDVGLGLVALAGELRRGLLIACRGITGQALGFGLGRNDLVLGETL